jgi:hypothetical protein
MGPVVQKFREGMEALRQRSTFKGSKFNGRRKTAFNVQ